ncbi:hypothetical protein [Pseudoalteromonas phage J2-1_QLiu-2017]|nr:hypothetical protein [Pseudoalteromonas phage J2-1_QLiu-2017]
MPNLTDLANDLIDTREINMITYVESKLTTLINNPDNNYLERNQFYISKEDFYEEMLNFDQFRARLEEVGFEFKEATISSKLSYRYDYVVTIPERPTKN